ncbi:MAG TPA: HDOD domain-containing protein [Candidatus Nitrosotalea sp.]|nr:HDOD domain-containing protein [Candidatus Nitrosotalea sp.]
MTSFVRSANSPPKPGSLLAQEQTEKRKQRVLGVLSQGLPTLPTYVLDLNALLSNASVDLKKVGAVIRTDPSLSAQVLRLCNSALFGLRRRVISIEQAAVLLGTERLRTLVLACSIMQFAGKRLTGGQLSSFWQHSFLCALLSERVARQVDYFEKEQAYLGGLLHDIGVLPLWIVVLEEEAKNRTMPPPDWPDNVSIEREYFGIDHCKVGRSMAVAWNFMPSFIDVFEHHHHPEKAQHDPYLVGIVAAADRFLLSQTDVAAAAPASDAAQSAAEPPAAFAPEELEFLKDCLPLLAESERHAVMEILQTEYIHLLPLVQLGLASATQ